MVEEEERCRVTVVVGLVLVVENGSVGGYSWHIGAARRPLTSPCLPLPLSRPLPPSFYPASRHLSPSHLSIPPLFPPISPRSLFLQRGPLAPFRATPLSATRRSRHYPCEPIHTHKSRPLQRLSPLCVCSSGFDPVPLCPSLFPRPPPWTFPFLLPLHPALPLPPPRRRCSLLRPAFIPQQNLRDYSSRR